MNINERQKIILQLLGDKKRATVAELAEHTQVSVVTIRHDLNTLEAQNYLKREHGMAILLDSDNVDARMKINFLQKQQLAELASTLIKPGDTLFIEGGSTNALLARTLVGRKDITIVTANLYIAQLLKKAEANVILLGGLIQSKSENVVGSLTRQCIKLINFNKAFIGIDGFHSDLGFSGRDMLRAEVIDAILDKQAENIVIAESTKFGQIHPYILHSSHHINRVVTDAGIMLEHEQQLTKRNIILNKVNINQ